MNDKQREDVGREGFEVYTERTLRNYDRLVHGFSNRFAWKCPTRKLHEMYAQNCSANHLEIGVGTGLFPDRLPKSHRFERLVLADPNAACLASASRRLARFSPLSCDLNLLRPESFGNLDEGLFDSIALNYVIHCLPGGISSLPDFLQQLRERLSVDGVLFGSTILGGGFSTGTRPNWLARWLMRLYQERGIFGNANDRPDLLEEKLRACFAVVQMRQVGCVVLFACRT